MQIQRNWITSLNTTQYINITFLVVSIIQFNIFGYVGLTGYGLLIVFGAAFFIVNRHKMRFATGTAFKIAIAYYAYFLIAALINGSYKMIEASLLTMLLLTLAGFVLRSNEEIDDNLISLAKILTIAGIVMCVLSFAVACFTYLFPEVVNSMPDWLSTKLIDIKGDFPRRMSGFVLNPNSTAEYSYMTACLSFYLLTKAKKLKWKFLAATNILISFITVFFLTASRTSMMAFLGFYGTYYVCHIIHLATVKKTKAVRLTLIVMIAIPVALLGILSILFAYQPTRDFIFEHIIRISSLATGSGRLKLYNEIFNIGKANRVVGVSIDTIKTETTNHAPHCHNSFLETLTFGGIPTLLLFSTYILISFIFSFKSIWRTKQLPYQTRSSALFFASIVVSQFLYGLTECCIDRTGISSFVYALSLASLHTVSRNHNDKEKSKSNKASS